jgi:hypothetical protein
MAFLAFQSRSFASNPCLSPYRCVRWTDAERGGRGADSGRVNAHLSWESRILGESQPGPGLPTIHFSYAHESVLTKHRVVGRGLAFVPGLSASKGGLLWSNAQSICPPPRRRNRLGPGFDHQEQDDHRHCALAPQPRRELSRGEHFGYAPLSTAALDLQSNGDPEPNSDLRRALRTMLVKSSLPACSSGIILRPQKIP